MNFIQTWLYAIAACLFISWAAVDEAPDEVAASQASADSTNDAQQAAVVAARRGE
jgi:hypothetical protein